MYRWFTNVLLCIATLSVFAKSTAESPEPSEPEQQLVILLYHHIDDETPRATSTTPEEFEQHLKYLSDQGYNLVPLPAALTALFAGEPLPDKAVAITFDDGYRSIADHALPILSRYEAPFSVFVATESIDKKYSAMLDWQQLKQLTRHRGSIESHSVSHRHLIDETITAEEIQQELSGSSQRIEQMIGKKPELFAYPYGEFSRELQLSVKKEFLFALAQMSGPAFRLSNRWSIPRFAAAGNYASMEAFALRVNTLALPVRGVSPTNVIFEPAATEQLQIKLSLANATPTIQSISCFLNGNLVTNQFHSPEGDSLTIHFENRLPAGRSRVNCTAPSRQRNRFYWFSTPLFVKPKDGIWPE